MSNRPMSLVLRKYFQRKLMSMGESVERVLVPEIDCDELYDQLINDPVRLSILRAACELMRRTTTYEEAQLSLRGKQYRIQLDMPATARTPQFLLPDQMFEVAPASKLGRTLLEQQAVTESWVKLRYVFDKFADLPVAALGVALPWLPDMAMDLDAHVGARPKVSEAVVVKFALNNLMSQWVDTFSDTGVRINKTEVLRAEDDLAVLIARRIPRKTLRMGDHVRHACKAGVTMISQYRMLMASGGDQKTDGPIRVLSRPTDLDKEFTEQVAETIRAWFHAPTFDD